MDTDRFGRELVPITPIGAFWGSRLGRVHRVKACAESGMVRISAIFIAVCMLLIAGSLGFVVYLRFGFTGAELALVALGVLTALGGL